MMKPRHEIKFEISLSDMLVLRSRLRAVAKPDPHTVGGRYEIRSLYFDDAFDTALREKLDGVNRRDKYRLRCYNGDSSFIALEKKSKINGMCFKQSEQITPEEAEQIISGEIKRESTAGRPLFEELRQKISGGTLKPKTIVDYTREPFIFPAGNVRVTLDYNIRTGLRRTDFLNPLCVTVPAAGDKIILEVKWDEFLPDVIRSAVNIGPRFSEAFSKYAVCRNYD